MSEEPEPAILQLGPLRPTDYLLNNFVAPGYVDVIGTALPLLDLQRKRWLGAFVLRSVFYANFDPTTRPVLFNFLRKTEAAVAEYELAAEAMVELAAVDRLTISPYFTALRHIESCLAHTDEAQELVRAVTDSRAFEKRDGSVLQRLRDLHNKSKHSFSDLSAGTALAVRLTPNGVCSPRDELSFDELAELVAGIARLAESILSAKPSDQGPRDASSV